MISDVIMTSYFRYATSYDKIMMIFGFSVPNFANLIKFGRNIELSVFSQFSVTGTSAGTQLCKELRNFAKSVLLTFSRNSNISCIQCETGTSRQLHFLLKEDS